MTNTPKHGNTPCVRYYVLFVWDKDYAHGIGQGYGRWTVEYGSYERKDVVDERAYYHESSSSIPIKHMRIKEICSCEAGQDDLLRLAQQENRP